MSEQWYDASGAKLSTADCDEVDQAEKVAMTAPTIDTDTMNRITMEVTLKKHPARKDTPDEAEYRAKITKEIAANPGREIVPIFD